MTFAGPLGALSCAETPWQSVAATAKPKPNSVFETAFMRKILLSERKTSQATFCDSSEQLAILGNAHYCEERLAQTNRTPRRRQEEIGATRPSRARLAGGRRES